MNKGIKYDQGKPDYSLLPFGSIDDLVRVITYGAEKYDRFNWKYVDKERYKAAALRHISSYMQGEVHDEETGIHHLAHAMANLTFIMELERNEAKPKNDQPFEELCYYQP